MKEVWNESTAVAKGLYDPKFEHDNCGIGAVVNIKGVKTHKTVEDALKIVENLKHRAGKDEINRSRFLSDIQLNREPHPDNMAAVLTV